MLSNNLYQNRGNKKLTKADLTKMMAFFCLPIYGGIVQSSNPKASIIIAVLCIVAMMIFYFSKLMRKDLSYADVCKNFGVLGFIGSVTMAGLFSVSVTASYKISIVIFFAFLIVQAIIIMLMEFKSRKKNDQDGKKLNSVIGISMVPFSVLGLYLSRYVNLSNYKIVCLFFVALFWVICVSFYNHFIKWKQLKDQSDEQSGDGTMIEP